MSNTVIEAKNIGKSYVIRHDSSGGQAASLSESIQKLSTRLFARGKSTQTPRKETFFALKNVSFSVSDGEVVGIIGRNGAGKSTLLKVLSRITEPTEGHARVNGRMASLLEVGSGFHPDLTGRENIFLNGSILGMSKTEIKSKFDEIVDFSGVERFLDTPVKRYSSGMHVRLAFSVAAHLEPDILIIDEVLAVGDAEFQERCLGKMEGVAKSGRTVIFVSHNLTAIRNFCTRAILLKQGQLVFDGAVDTAIARYSGESRTTENLQWSRSETPEKDGLYFSDISVTLEGQQPKMNLQCRLGLRTKGIALRSMLAVDIIDPDGTPVMQALPSSKPIVDPANDRQEFLVNIELPPLIPGVYSVNLWVGPDYNSGTDFQAGVTSFAILDSPTPGRTVPHAKKLGSIVPISTATKVLK